MIFMSIPGPPGVCRNIRIDSMNDGIINISWMRSTEIGRDDFYYTVEYSDGESTGSHPLRSDVLVVRDSIGGLKANRDYTISVSVKNGVSDQDPLNEQFRTCSLTLTTEEDSKYMSTSTSENSSFHLFHRNQLLTLCLHIQYLRLVEGQTL